MFSMKSTLVAFASGLVMFAVASCGQLEAPTSSGDISYGAKSTVSKGGSNKKKNDTATVVSGTGVVRQLPNTMIPGTYFYGIELADGTRYEVVNFPSGAFVDGQTVNFSGYLLTTWTSTNNYGQGLLLSAISAA